MKKFSILLLAQLFTIVAFCQPEMKTELLTDPNFTDIDLNEDFLDIPIYILLENTGTDTAFLKWTYREKDAATCTSAWATYACDNKACYGELVTSNVNPPGSGPNVPSPVVAGESYEFAFHVKPDKVAGCCTILIDFSYAATPNQIFSTIEIPIQINDPDCTNQSTSIDDLEDSHVKVYPTHTQDLITIDCNPSTYNRANLISSTGEFIRSFQIAHESTVHAISDLPGGLFYVELVGEKISQLKKFVVAK